MKIEEAYDVRLDGDLLPQTPIEITYSWPQNIESLRTSNAQNHTINHGPGPLEISFECWFTHDWYPYQFDYEVAYHDPAYWMGKFRDLMQIDRHFTFWVGRGGRGIRDPYRPITIYEVYLSDFTLLETSEYNDDFKASIKLTERCEQLNMETSVDFQNHMIQVLDAKGWASGGEGRKFIEAPPAPAAAPEIIYDQNKLLGQPPNETEARWVIAPEPSEVNPGNAESQPQPAQPEEG